MDFTSPPKRSFYASVMCLLCVHSGTRRYMDESIEGEKADFFWRKHLTTSRYRDKLMSMNAEKTQKLIDMELLEKVAPTLRALAHPMRLRIVDFIRDGEQPVSKGRTDRDV